MIETGREIDRKGEIEIREQFEKEGKRERKEGYKKKFNDV